MKRYSIRAVIGAGAGDEGKGNVAAMLSEAPGRTVGVLTNGGPQRGHTVCREGKRHIFSHFCAGTLAGADSYFAASFMVNPMQFMREYRELLAIGAAPRAMIDRDCRFTTPYDMLLNQKGSLEAGTHHTCGMGIWETYVRCRDHGRTTVGDYLAMTESERYACLARIRDRAIRRLTETLPAERAADTLALMASDALLFHYMDDMEDMIALCGGKTAGPEVLLSYDNVILENGQGLMLDWSDDEEAAVYTTPSRTGLKAVTAVTDRVFAGQTVEAVYVTRTYQTRHGDGPMEEECHPDALEGRVRETTNAANPFQGRFRFGRLHVEAMDRRIRRDLLDAGSRNTCRRSLAITHIDQLAPGEELLEEAAFFDEVYLIGKP